MTLPVPNPWHWLNPAFGAQGSMICSHLHLHLGDLYITTRHIAAWFFPERFCVKFSSNLLTWREGKCKIWASVVSKWDGFREEREPGFPFPSFRRFSSAKPTALFLRHSVPYVIPFQVALMWMTFNLPLSSAFQTTQVTSDILQVRDPWLIDDLSN